RALFGRLAFTQAAWDLLKESGAKALSLGLDRETLAIREVSLVRFPRIASARVFSDTALALFTFDLLPEETGGNGEAMKDIHSDAAPDGGELIELRRQLRERD